MGVDKKMNRRDITNIILAILVLSSIVLSFSLWTTGNNIGEETSQSPEDSPSRVSLMIHSLEEVYRPRLIAFHGIDSEEPLVVSNSYELNDFLEESMAISNLSRIKKVEALTKEDYLEKIQNGKWVEFVYPAEQPFGLISSKFTDLTEENADLFFDRLLFDQYHPEEVSFYHMESGTLYTAEKTNEQKIRMEELLHNEENNFIAAEAFFSEDQMNYLPKSSVDVSYQSYIIDQFPKRTYVNNFFPDTSLVDVRSASNYTRYIDLSKEVTINEDNHTLTYLSQSYTSGQMSPEARYKRSFEEINQYENWSEDLIFSDFDRAEKTLSYRREIEGLPVFSENEYESLLEIELVDEGLTHMKLPLRFINTPIDIKDSPEKTLPSGGDMINKLKEELTDEEFQSISEFSIGYSWLESNENDKVINFEPSWYVNYKDEWMSYSSLLELNKETAYGF